MLHYRFANEAQKEVHLATLRDLFVENHDDQVARTALTNAIAMAEATLVTGELDEMIAKTNRMHRRTIIVSSVFFGLLAAFEFGFGFMIGGFAQLGYYAMGAAILFYVVAMWAIYRIQLRYYTTLKWLEGVQLELPQVPRSLAAN